MSYDDVQVFLSRINLNQQDGYTYRLPLEAEWEYAARNGSNYYSEIDPTKIALHGWFKDKSDGHTHEVATLQPNALGLYDMHSNVWQWVQDWFGDYPSCFVTNPTGPSSGRFRILRGGGYFDTAIAFQSSVRIALQPDTRSHSFGFRLVRVRSI